MVPVISLLAAYALGCICTGYYLVRLCTGEDIRRLGSGNVVADPLFDNAFHLRSGSPAADGGKKLGSLYPKLDRLGKKRLKGKAPDLGAHEDF